MRVSIPTDDLKIYLGFQGESEATEVLISVDGWKETFGDGTFSLLNQRPTEEAAYPVVFTETNETIKWIPSSGDMAICGIGRMQLIYTVDEAIAKSLTYMTRIDPSLDASADPPDPWESWVQEVIDAKDAAEAAAQEIEDLTVSAETLPAGSDATVTKTKEEGEPYNLMFGIPRGPQGEQGPTGPTGASAYSFTDNGNGNIVITENE